MTPLCFVDTETTSLRPDRRAWEVALIRRDDVGVSETSFFIQVYDINLPEADPFSLDVGRFWDRHPQARDGNWWDAATYTPDEIGMLDRHGDLLDATTAAQAVRSFTHGAHLVGIVPSFDAEVFAALLRDNWLSPTWHYHLVDVETLAVGWLTGRGLSLSGRPTAAPPWESDDVSRAVGVDPPGESERHTALGDARWAMRLYDAVVASPTKESD